MPPASENASEQIDAIIGVETNWKGATLANLRAMILDADPEVVEQVKWKKPSNPAGVPVWSHDGIVCVANILKAAVRLTFPRGAQMKDPKGLFNARMDSGTVRAIDVPEGGSVNARAFKALIRDAVRINASER